MSTAPNSNSRASLLSGLRTGGVRSTSASIPHTAAPGATFNLPRINSSHSHPIFPEEDDDQLAEIPSNFHSNYRNHPMTAAVDGPGNRFSQQQRGMNPNSTPFTPSFVQPNNAQALQMQMMQLEILRIQAIQAQQYQAELLAQAQRQAQAQNNRRTAFNPPATAGPLSTSFDIRSATLSAQMRRANQADQFQSQLGVGVDDQVPMTAALGGKFGSRSVSASVPGRYPQDDSDTVPPTPGGTTVISGGIALGNTNSNVNGNTVPSKSDSVSSWRRGGKGNSVLANRSVTSPSVKITPPDALAAKTRPQPLRFSAVVSQPLPTVTIDTSDGNDDDTSSTSSSKSGASHSSPTTPRSSSSNEIPLSPREEASKKLYEGLGIGRPASGVADINGVEVAQDFSLPASVVVPHRMVSQPTRQPRGPPSGADELGPKNFATRIRRQAIGGLGMLMGARERRELVEAF
ncbi:hypothetical protein D9758_001251 [Tetrapyrgos nigripes]|uniref:Uncharacterized protein n=1 Tax=Tetrapyrgos nigripes TaxID=182062 RepID=A0A8H5LUI9_9AGAR|nr:hypothetical protein D9758_001251 [Tetrapyrgos nigripes]